MASFDSGRLTLSDSWQACAHVHMCICACVHVDTPPQHPIHLFIRHIIASITHQIILRLIVGGHCSITGTLLVVLMGLNRHFDQLCRQGDVGDVSAVDVRDVSAIDRSMDNRLCVTCFRTTHRTRTPNHV